MVHIWILMAHGKNFFVWFKLCVHMLDIASNSVIKTSCANSVPTIQYSTLNLTILYYTVLYILHILYCTTLHHQVTPWGLRCVLSWVRDHYGGLDLYITEVKITALHLVALRCTKLHCTALHCTPLHFTALHCTVQASLHVKRLD